MVADDPPPPPPPLFAEPRVDGNEMLEFRGSDLANWASGPVVRIWMRARCDSRRLWMGRPARRRVMEKVVAWLWMGQHEPVAEMRG